MPSDLTSAHPDATANATPAISLVIPVYNEEESLSALFDALDASIVKLPQPVEAILVDYMNYVAGTHCAMDLALYTSDMK